MRIVEAAACRFAGRSLCSSIVPADRRAGLPFRTPSLGCLINCQHRHDAINRRQLVSIESAFIADIAANPDDDTPRLIYADWLEEHGQPQRAEFIRVEVEMGQVGPYETGSD
jgi:uncharacterized protein (TIGR02996 family)